MKTLPKLSEYGEKLDIRYFDGHINLTDYQKENSNYRKLITQSLNISHFVPAKLIDGVWGLLEEPINFFSDSPNKEESKMYQNSQAVKEYQTALDNCVFKGFIKRNEDWYSNGILDIDEEFIENKTIEDVIKYNLEITDKIAEKFKI